MGWGRVWGLSTRVHGLALGVLDLGGGLKDRLVERRYLEATLNVVTIGIRFEFMATSGDAGLEF